MTEMTTQEIIQKSDEVKAGGMDWKDVYKAVYGTVMMNTHRVLRSGNTLAWIELLPNDAARVDTFNADTPKNYVKNLREFAKALDKAGFKSAIVETPNPKIIEVVKGLGYPVKVETTQDKSGATIYRGTINV